MWKADVADGGHIRIKKVNITKSNYLMHIIASLEDKMTAGEVDIYLSNFLSYELPKKRQSC